MAPQAEGDLAGAEEGDTSFDPAALERDLQDVRDEDEQGAPGFLDHETMDPKDIFPKPAETVRAKQIAGSELLTIEQARARIAEWKAEAERIGREEDHSNDPTPRDRMDTSMLPRTEAERRWPLRPPPQHLQRRYLDAGLWVDTTLGAFVDERLQANASRELRIWSRARPYEGTIGEVRRLALKVAGGLQAAGIGPGDVVAFQLPNWMEAAATFYGASLLGAVLVPIVHFYGAKEVRFILAHTGAKALVTAASFRQSDYLAALATFRAALPALATVVVVGEHAPTKGTVPFDELTRASPIAESSRAST
jgi:hypothetical protein